MKKNPHSNHNTPSQKKSPKTIFFPKLFRLFLKQTITAILCAAVILPLHHFDTKPFSGYADALGQALRYQTDLTKLKDSGFAALKWLQGRFSTEREMSETE